MSYSSSKMLFAKYAITFVLSFAMVCTLLAGVNVVAFAADDNDLIVSVKCFYNDAEKGGDGEHLFTKDEGEISWLSSLPTWNNQGEAWKAPVSSSLAIYRCYNPFSGEHHYAAAGEAEWLVSQGWTQEKLAFYSDDNMGVPVYRLWNGLAGVGSHYYTTNEFEKDILVAGGWQFEGVNFYGVKGEEPTTKALSASQVGKDKIMVSSEDGFTGEESFVVSHGDLIDELAGEPEYDEELDVYTITLADPIVEAVYTVSCDGYTPATFEGEEQGEKEMTATQTGRNEITVTSNTEFTELEEFTVTTAYGEEASDFEFLDENTVVITLDSEIEEDEYTVTCSDEEYEPVSFVGEEAEVTHFIFGDDQLIVNAARTGASVTYSTVDQWYDPIIDDSVEFSVAGYGHIDQPVGDGTGMFTVTGANIAVGSKIPVAVIYADKTKVENVTFEVVATSVVADMQVLDLIPNPEFTEEHQAALALARKTSARLTPANSLEQEKGPNYVLPVKAYDQYGNVLSADQLNGMLDSSLYVQQAVTAGQIQVAGIVSALKVNNKIFAQGTDGYVLVPVVSNGTTAGNGVLSFLSVGGFTTTMTIEVAQNEMVDTIDVTVGTLVYDQPSPIDITAKNQYDEVIDLSVPGALTIDGNDDIVITYNGDNTSKVSLDNGTFKTGEDYGMPDTIFATSTSNTGIDFMSISPASKKVSYKQLTVKPEAVPATVQGVNPEFNTVLSDAVQTISLSGAGIFVFLDNYGEIVGKELNPVDQPTYKAGATDLVAGHYYYSVEPSSQTYTDFNSATGVVEPQDDVDGPGSDTYTVYLYKATAANAWTELNHKTFKMSLAGEAKSFVATATLPSALSDTLYVGDDAGAIDVATVTVYGVDAAGNKFLLQGGYALTVDNDLSVNNTNGKVSGSFDIDDGLKEGTATVSVYVGGKVVTTTTVNYSNAPCEALAVIAYSATNVDNARTYTPLLTDTIPGADGMTINQVAEVGDCNTVKIVTTGTQGYVIQAYDQYGHVFDGTEVTLIDATGAILDNEDDSIDQQELVANPQGAVLVMVENGDEDLMLTITGVNLPQP